MVSILQGIDGVICCIDALEKVFGRLQKAPGTFC